MMLLMLKIGLLDICVFYREIKFGALLEHLPLDAKTGQRSWFATGAFELSLLCASCNVTLM